MSLFANLFGGDARASASGLFSSGSKYVSTEALAPAAPRAGQQSAAPPAGAAVPPAAADGGGKKRRKEQAASGAAAAAEKGDKQSKKKQRKSSEQQQQQQGAAAADNREKKGQSKAAAMAAATAAAAAAAAGVPAPAEPQGKPKKEKKQQAKAAVAAAGSAPQGAPAGGSDQQQGQQQQQQAAVKEKKAAKQQQPVKPGKAAAGAAAAEDPRLPRTVFVGNLPATAKHKALAKLFAECGAVESVRLRSLPLKQDAKSAKMPRRLAIAAGSINTDHSAHAYVVFEEVAAVEQALKLNMTEWEGHHLRVDRAAPKAAKGAVVFDPQRSLFVGNLPLDVKDEEVIQHFGARSVEAVRVVRDARTGAGKGVAFVLLCSQEACKAALKQRDGSELKGRKLRVTRVKRQAGGADGKAAWQQGKGGSSGAGGGGKGKPSAGKRKAGGKRPAVAARKQAAKLKATSGGVQKKKAAA